MTLVASPRVVDFVVFAGSSSDDDDGPPWFLVLIALAFILVGFGVGLSNWRKKWVVDDTPTSRVAAIFMGRNEVIGVARPITQLASPVSLQPCVWYEWKIEEYVKRNKNSSWETRYSAETAAPFWLEDESGHVLIRPRGADIKGGNQSAQHKLREGPPHLTPGHLLGLVHHGEDDFERQRGSQAPWPGPGPDLSPAQNGILGKLKAKAASFSSDQMHRPFSNFASDWRITEQVICEGQELYILGDASLRPDFVAPQFMADEAVDATLLIDTRDEAEISRKHGLGALGGFAAALIGVILLPMTIHATATWEEFGPISGRINLINLPIISKAVHIAWITHQGTTSTVNGCSGRIGVAIFVYFG